MAAIGGNTSPAARGWVGMPSFPACNFQGHINYQNILISISALGARGKHTLGASGSEDP